MLGRVLLNPRYSGVAQAASGLARLARGTLGPPVWLRPQIRSKRLGIRRHAVSPSTRPFDAPQPQAPPATTLGLARHGLFEAESLAKEPEPDYPAVDAAILRHNRRELPWLSWPNILPPIEPECNAQDSKQQQHEAEFAIERIVRIL